VGAGEALLAMVCGVSPLSTTYWAVRDGKDMITRFVLISEVESPRCIRRVRRHSNPDSRPSISLLMFQVDVPTLLQL
jgi:hypothetical protein